MRRFRQLYWLALVAATLLAPTTAALAQGTTRPKIRDTNVGYIDPAIPGDVFRFRYDSSYQNLRPTLAEFFWTPGPRGPKIPESNVDYQDLTSYLEALITDDTSVYVEVPVRFLDPTLNPNTAGFGDMNFGFKHSFLVDEDSVTTFQFRTYIPSGDYERGLGNGHVSLEPAFLVYQQLGERWGFEGEVRDWIPINGTSFAGNVVRYGLGLHYDIVREEDLRISPVVEFVGWTVLDGKVAVRQSPDLVEIQNAARETIVNVKAGLRTKIGQRMDLYGGYGRCLTGNLWYRDTFRVELRFFY